MILLIEFKKNGRQNMYKTADQISWNVLLKAAASEGGNPALWRRMVDRIAKSKGMPPPTNAEFAEMFPPDFSTSSKTMEDAIQGSKWFNKPTSSSSTSSAGYNPSSSNPYTGSYQDSPYSRWSETASERKARWAKEDSTRASEQNAKWTKDYQEKAKAQDAERKARYAKNQEQWEKEYQQEAQESQKRWDTQAKERQAGYDRSSAAQTEKWKYRDQAYALDDIANFYGKAVPVGLGIGGLAVGSAIEDKEQRDPFMGITGAGVGASAGYGRVQQLNADRLRGAINEVPFTVDEGFKTLRPYNKVKAAPHTIAGGLVGLGLGLGGSHLIQKAFYDNDKQPQRKAASEIAASVLSCY